MFFLKAQVSSLRAHATLEPDGTAAACKAAFSGFDSRRRLFEAGVRLMAFTSGALRLATPIGSMRSVYGF